ncbi:MAG: plastocyanin/azurin family copper-binding protein [Bacteroidia bacterium]
MKKIYITILLMACATVLSFKSYATKFTVNVADFSFAPSSITVTVGDTVRWVRINGTHTTTCNGSALTSRPAGAPSWDNPINASNTSFEYVVTVAGAYAYKCTPHASGGMTGTITAVPPNGIANLNGLFNYLEINPPTFKSDAEIKFSLASNAHIKLSIYDFAGRKIVTLLDEQFIKGEHTALWDANGIPQGIYFCRLENEDYTLTRKFVRVK